MRSLSVKCFNDSKYFEKHLKNKLVSIAKRYEPETINAALEEVTEKEILNQIGIITAPEIFELCGRCSFKIENDNINIAAFKKGYCINSESTDAISEFYLDCIHRVLFVENRTNYRQLVTDGVAHDTLVIFHGGFYSPARGRFFEKIYSAASSNTEFLFWGDIDLGGFNMFARLRKHIIPKVMPYKMDCETFMSVIEKGISSHSDKYFENLRLCKCEDEFQNVKELILKYKLTVEQESLIL
jgi:hypothetical protein